MLLYSSPLCINIRTALYMPLALNRKGPHEGNVDAKYIEYSRHDREKNRKKKERVRIIVDLEIIRVLEILIEQAQMHVFGRLKLLNLVYTKQR